MKHCSNHEVRGQKVEATCGLRKSNGMWYFLCDMCADAVELGQSYRSATLDSIEDIELEEERESETMIIRPGPEFEYEDYYKM